MVYVSVRPLQLLLSATLCWGTKQVQQFFIIQITLISTSSI